MTTTDHRRVHKGNEQTGTRGGRRTAPGSSGGTAPTGSTSTRDRRIDPTATSGADATGMPGADPTATPGADAAANAATPSRDTAESLSEAIFLLKSFVAAFEPGRYSGDDAAVLVERFCVGEHLCATGKALAAKRAAETELHRRDGLRSAAEWLSRKTGDSLGAAAGSLHLVDQMTDHPELGQALRKGQLSHARARQVADVLDVDPTSEEELVDAAKDSNETNRQLQDRCLRVKAQARSAEDTRSHYERIRASRYLRHYTDRDGAFRLEGLFTPDAGAKLLAALKPTRTVLFDEARRIGLRERPDAYEADALVALLAGERLRPSQAKRANIPRTRRASTGTTTTGTTSSEESGSEETRSSRGGSGRAVSGDGGANQADSDWAEPGQADGTDSDPERCDQATTGCALTSFPPPASVHLRVDLAALRRGHLEGGECCEIPGVGPVPVETARSVLGDAVLRLVITNGADIATVSNLGRTIRAPLRTALIERDQTCVVPGCNVRDGLEIDHRIVPVVENGETALWNLARICHHHHYLRHHKGFRLEGGPGGWEWLPPERPPPSNQEGLGTSGDDDQLFRLE